MPDLFLESDDSCLYVTEACNSNCIMCPMSEESRKRGKHFSASDWEKALLEIPQDTEHITITGGEPFLEYERLLPALEHIRVSYPYTPVLILTNGRALSLKSIQSHILPSLNEHMCFAIPIHSYQAEKHDRITQSPGSFEQTLNGLRFLSQTKAKIEIRIVAHQHNINELNEIFIFLANSGIKIDIINLLAMEMTGCAAANRNSLWVDYRDIYPKAKQGIEYSVKRGIDVGLYNFPLCSVPKSAWPLCRNSITCWKIRYDEQCEVCNEKNTCGGMFFSTQALKLFCVEPIM